MASKASKADELPLDDVVQETKARPLPLRSNSGGPAPSIIARPASAAPRMTHYAPRRFAGFTYGQLGIGALILGAAIWGMWATAKIFALEDRRVVSVRLASIVNDFVTAEARSGTPPEQLETRTHAFMSALDTVLKTRAAGGQVVLVGEAVIAASVPDVTNDVVADLSRIVKMPMAAAMPPAMVPANPPVPVLGGAAVPVGPAPVPAQQPVILGGGTPFGDSLPPAELGLQP